MTKIILHCGSHKTASSTLQEKIFPLMANYRYVGKSLTEKYPDSYNIGVHLTNFCIQASRLRESSRSRLYPLINKILKSLVNANKSNLMLFYSNESLLQNLDFWNFSDTTSSSDPPLIPIIELEKLGILSSYCYMFGFKRRIEEFVASLYLEISKKRLTHSLPIVSLAKWLDYQLDLHAKGKYSILAIYNYENLNNIANHNVLKNIKFYQFDDLLSSPSSLLKTATRNFGIEKLKFSCNDMMVDEIFRQSKINSSSEKKHFKIIYSTNKINTLEELKSICLDKLNKELI